MIHARRLLQTVLPLFAVVLFNSPAFSQVDWKNTVPVTVPTELSPVLKRIGMFVGKTRIQPDGVFAGAYEGIEPNQTDLQGFFLEIKIRELDQCSDLRDVLTSPALHNTLTVQAKQFCNSIGMRIVDLNTTAEDMLQQRKIYISQSLSKYVTDDLMDPDYFGLLGRSALYMGPFLRGIFATPVLKHCSQKNFLRHFIDKHFSDHDPLNTFERLIHVRCLPK